MPKSLEEIAKEHYALGDKRRLCAFKDIGDGKSPEDAYLKNVWNFFDVWLAAVPQSLKSSIRTIPDTHSFYDQFGPWLSKLEGVKDFCNAWPNFNSFYKPFIDAKLLTTNYVLTNNAKKLYEKLKSDLE